MVDEDIAVNDGGMDDAFSDDNMYYSHGPTLDEITWARIKANGHSTDVIHVS